MAFSHLDHAFGYLESFTNFEKLTPQSVRDFKMDRMITMLDLFGNPHTGMQLFHIAGSKGKGSTGRFLAEILKKAGHPTGLYSSPHVMTYRERITMAGAFLPDTLLLEEINSIHDVIGDGSRLRLAGEDENPTTFELLTLLAFCVFRSAGCTHAVIETGIGGKLDATNVVAPAACLLTPVELEHTDILGDTIEEIAFQKAGIIKPGVPVFSAAQNRTVRNIFTQTASDQGSEITFLDDQLEGVETSLERSVMNTTLRWKGGTEEHVHLKMFGDFQAENCALAMVTARRLELADDKTIETAVGEAHLPGRMEISGDKPQFIMDAAHTPSSLMRLGKAYLAYFTQPAVYIFGCVSGKLIDEMAPVLSTFCREIIVSTPGTFKKSDPESVFRTVAAVHPESVFRPSPEAALETALEKAGLNTPVIITGSFYMINEIRKLVPVS